MKQGNQPRLGIVGAGSVVRSHLDAGYRAGFIPTSICGRGASKNALQISSEIETLNYCESFESLLETEIDALLIAVTPESSIEVLQEGVKLGIPILIEKPVGLTSKQFQNLADIDCSRVLVGFNRRHYSSVSTFKTKVSAMPSGLIKVDIPELSWEAQTSNALRKRMLFENSVHVFDLINYIFGEVEPIEVSKISDSEGTKYAILTFKTKFNFVGSVSLSFGTPENISMSVWSNQINVELNPLEFYKEYTSILGLPPTSEIPFKRYVKSPNQAWSLSISDQVSKPGFVEQYLELFKMVKGDHKNLISARIRDAEKALKMAELMF